MEKICNVHGLTDFSEGNRPRCRKCLVIYVTNKRIRNKLKAIAYKGGKCVKCGYNKCPDALEFHHLDPNEKDFGISTGSTIAWKKVEKELDKCILVCANCHREIHHNGG